MCAACIKVHNGANLIDLLSVMSIPLIFWRTRQIMFVSLGPSGCPHGDGVVSLLSCCWLVGYCPVLHHFVAWGCDFGAFILVLCFVLFLVFVCCLHVYYSLVLFVFGACDYVVLHCVSFRLP